MGLLDSKLAQIAHQIDQLKAERGFYAGMLYNGRADDAAAFIRKEAELIDEINGLLDLQDSLEKMNQRLG